MFEFDHIVYINQNKSVIIVIYVNDFLIFARDIIIFISSKNIFYDKV
jgi:hypothetical protein